MFFSVSTGLSISLAAPGECVAACPSDGMVAGYESEPGSFEVLQLRPTDQGTGKEREKETERERKGPERNRKEGTVRSSVGQKVFIFYEHNPKHDAGARLTKTKTAKCWSQSVHIL